MTTGAGVESQLPAWLQLNNNPLDPSDRAKYEQNYYDQYIAPGIANTQASLYSNGQGSGSYGGAMMAQGLAQGELTKYQAGLDYANSLYNSMLSGRTSYFAGGPAVAQTQNAADVSRGNAVAGLQSTNANNQNSYNLNSANNQNTYNSGGTSMNNSNAQTIYSDQLAALALKQKQQQAQYSSLISGLGLAGEGVGALMSGGTSLAVPAATAAFKMPTLAGFDPYKGVM